MVETKQEEIKPEETKILEPEPIKKKSIILGIDPGFVKCGFGILEFETGNYVESF